MAPELSIFMSEPLAVRPRAAREARPLTRHGSQLWWHWSLAASKWLSNDQRLAPCRSLKINDEELQK